MSLNDLSLPPQLLTGLYGRVLVGDTASAVPQTPALSFLGKNGKNILIVVNQPATPFLPDRELDFLTKVLMACQLGLLDVAVVNWGKSPHQDAAAAMEQLKAKAVILFAVDPQAFGLPATLLPYTVESVANTQFVVAPALHEIEKNKEAKQRLWMALKQLFGL